MKPAYSSMRLGSSGVASLLVQRGLICKSGGGGSGLPAGAKVIVLTSCGIYRTACSTRMPDEACLILVESQSRCPDAPANDVSGHRGSRRPRLVMFLDVVELVRVAGCIAAVGVLVSSFYLRLMTDACE